MKAKEKEPKEKFTISAYEFANSEWFLRRSPGHVPFFIKVERQMYQNLECKMSGEEFMKLHKEYTALINKSDKK